MKTLRYVCLFLTVLAVFSAALMAQSPAYQFKAVLQPGMAIGGHVFDQQTVVEPDLAFNDQGVVVFVSHWQLADQLEHTAVFTQQRQVAAVGDVIEGHTILVIAGAWPVINALGQVAYPALYANDPGKKDVRLGLFIDRHLSMTLDSSDAVPPFALDNNGKVSLVKATSSSRCEVPPFPMPQGWLSGDHVTPGPIASHRTQASTGVRFYDSSVLGRITLPTRTVQYAADCRPLVIVLGDGKQYEAWTSAGLLTYMKRGFGYLFNGFPTAVPAGSFLRADTTLRMNRRGQVALPVTLHNGTTILVGTPSGGGR
jgi:hypothetical protein